MSEDMISELKEELKHARSMYARAIHNCWGDSAEHYWLEILAIQDLLKKYNVEVIVEKLEHKDMPC